MSDLVLPAFEMDCRDWIVVGPDEAGMADGHDGAPVLAVLSSVVFDGAELREASAVLTVGLLDDEQDLPTHELAPGAVAQRLVDDVSGRYVMPAPDRRLAVVAEFAPTAHPELRRRAEQLMLSFRWQCAV
jgi:hypothetical protein